jgi:hypothetical protein
MEGWLYVAAVIDRFSYRRLADDGKMRDELLSQRAGEGKSSKRYASHVRIAAIRRNATFRTLCRFESGNLVLPTVDEVITLAEHVYLSAQNEAPRAPVRTQLYALQLYVLM